jgi:hypothetical protein
MEKEFEDLFLYLRVVKVFQDYKAFFILLIEKYLERFALLGLGLL